MWLTSLNDNQVDHNNRSRKRQAACDVVLSHLLKCAWFTGLHYYLPSNLIVFLLDKVGMISFSCLQCSSKTSSTYTSTSTTIHHSCSKKWVPACDVSLETCIDREQLEIMAEEQKTTWSILIEKHTRGITVHFDGKKITQWNVAHLLDLKQLNRVLEHIHTLI